MATMTDRHKLEQDVLALADERNEVVWQLQRGTASRTERVGLETRKADLEERIEAMVRQLEKG